MVWIAIAALTLALAAATAAILLWRRVRRIELGTVRKSVAGSQTQRSAYDSMELSLEAMLEELEARGREVMKKIDLRERELRETLVQADALVRQALSANQVPFTSAASAERSPESPETAKEEPTAGSRQKVAAVWQLADEGHDVLAIAKRLGLGKGEVELILELRETSSR